MDSPSTFKKFFLLYSSLLLTTPLAYGALYTTIETGADGVTAGNHTFTSGGSWTGDGTVKPVNSTDTSDTDLVIGLTSGTLFTDEITADQNLIDPNFSQNHHIASESGSLDLQGRFFDTDGSAATLNRYSVTTVGNVSKITWQVVNSTRLHAKFAGSSTNNYASWLGGLRKIAGSTNMDIKLTWSDIVTIWDYNDPASDGIDGFIVFFYEMENSGLDTIAEVNETIEATGSDIINKGTDPGAGLNSIHWARLFDANRLKPTQGTGPNGYTAAELSDDILSQGEQLHASTLTFEITPTGGGTFDEGTTFVVSFDGLQGPDSFSIANVPEPSSIMFSIMGFFGIVLRRKRSNCKQ